MSNISQKERFVIVAEGHPLRSEVERIVTERYNQAFNANVDEFMPNFSCLLGKDGEILSVCGFRAAGASSLFLEQYLDQPAETLISEHFQQSVPRDSIIEFGQLASFSRGVSLQHFSFLSHYLVEQGYRWCIFTATGPLYALMRRFGLSPEALVPADAARIENAERIWGNYYCHKPKVSAGDLVKGAEQLLVRQQPSQSEHVNVAVSGGTHG